MNGRDHLGWRADVPAVRDALALVGLPGSRRELPTPALVVDLDVFDANVALMAARARAAGLALRPHAKSHKCSFLARRQLAAGALGVCCAKLGEAEAMVAGGVGHVLLTSPIVDGRVRSRLAALAATADELRLAVDSEPAIAVAAAAATQAGAIIGVLVDVDVGLARTGTADRAAAGALAGQVVARAGLRLEGVQGYGGSWQHIADPRERAAQVEAGMARLLGAIAAVEEYGPVSVRSGGGTGTARIDGELGVLTEVQAGSYVFMDRQYRDALGAGPDDRYEHSLFVQTQVVSANHPGWVTVDAGLKAFATDAGAPVVADPTRAAAYSFFGDEQGRLTPSDGASLRLGERIELVPPHCDPTVDRYDVYHLVRGDTLVDLAPIDGRGRSQ